MKPSQIVSFKAVLNQEIQFDDKNEVCLDNLSIDELNNKVEMYNKLFLENVIISDHLYSSSAFIGYEGPSMLHTASFIPLVCQYLWVINSKYPKILVGFFYPLFLRPTYHLCSIYYNLNKHFFFRKSMIAMHLKFI